MCRWDDCTFAPCCKTTGWNAPETGDGKAEPASVDTEFDFRCEESKESNDEMRGGDIKAQELITGSEGDAFPISGSTMEGDIDRLFTGLSRESSTTGIRDWQ